MKETPISKIMSPAEKFSYQLQHIRTSLKVSQSELADRAGITQTVISKIEAGSANPTLATIERIAAALNMELSITLRLKR